MKNIKEAFEALGAWGNSNHYLNYLNKFEHEIKSNKEYNKPLSDAANYFAWLLVAPMFIIHRIRELLFLDTKDIKIFDCSFKDLLDNFNNNYNPDKEGFNCIMKFIKIRHLLIHKGFRNPHIKPSTNKTIIADGYPFKAKEVIELGNEIANPNNYDKLLQCFKIAIATVDSFKKGKTCSF